MSRSGGYKAKVRTFGIATALLLTGGSPGILAQPAREQLTIGITQYPATLHPNIESMAAKSYVLGFARRPLTIHDHDWRPACMGCETLPSLENGLAQMETTPDGRTGIRVTWRLREGWRWGDGTPVSAEDLLFAWQAGRDFATGFGGSEFYRSAYEAIVVDPRSITLRFDRVTFDHASAGEWQPLPAHIERRRWEQDPRSYRTRSAAVFSTVRMAMRRKAGAGPFQAALRSSVMPAPGVTCVTR